MHRHRADGLRGEPLMSESNIEMPKEGDLVVCSVSSVKQNGAYVDLDEFPGVSGFIFIGEIASGWVKNIRGHVREGQRVVCKVMRTRRDGKSMELSLKSVSEERKRDRLTAWKNEQRAHQILKVLGEKLEWDEEQITTLAEDLHLEFGSLYGAFEEAAMHNDSLSEMGFKGEWIAPFIEIAVENIIPDFVQIRGVFTLSSNAPDGVEAIRAALVCAEENTDEEREIKVTCHYDGAPSYRVEITAPDFKSGEDTWEKVTADVITSIEAAGGEGQTMRE